MDKKWWVLLAMCLLTVMLNIDVTALNLAIPVIAQEFHASLSLMQWVINAYVLLSAMLQIFGGKLGDSWSHRKVFLLGTALFVLSSAGAGLSMDTQMLIGFRVLQGVALGIAYPVTITLAFASFPKHQQGFALSFIVGAMGISLAIGPPIGGIFVDTIGWRWIFYVNVPIGCIAYLLAHLFCEKKQSSHSHSIDYKGVSLLIVALFGVVFAINQAQDWGFVSYPFLIIFSLGLVFFYFLYAMEKGKQDPTIDFTLFKRRNFLFNNLIRLIVQLIFIPALFFTPLYLQNIAQFSSLFTGVIVMAMTVVIAILSPLAGKWVDRAGDRWPNIIAMLAFLLASCLFLFLKAHPNLWILSIALALIGVGVGVTFVSTITGGLAVVPPEKHGVATGALFTLAWL